MGLNKVIVQGRTIKDPEMKYSSTGTAITNATISVQDSFKKGADGYYESELWDIVAFGKSAEFLANHGHKGTEFNITGRLTKEHWIDKTTAAKRNKTVIVAESFDFCGGKRPEGTAPPVDDTADEPDPFADE